MRKIVDVTGEGLDSFLGERVTFFCANYIYTGRLVGVNDTFVRLAKPSIVYETGPFNDPKWRDAQALPNEMNIMLGFVESWGVVK